MPDSRPRSRDGAEDIRPDDLGTTGDDAELEALRDRLATLEAENELLTSRLGASRPLVDALRESEQRFRTILASEPACVKLVAEDGALLSMNPAGLEMIEARSEDEALGLCVFDLVLPGDRRAFIDLHERAPEAMHSVAVVHSRPLVGGERHSLSRHVVGLGFGDGNVDPQRRDSVEGLLIEGRHRHAVGEGYRRPGTAPGSGHDRVPTQVELDFERAAVAAQAARGDAASRRV